MAWSSAGTADTEGDTQLHSPFHETTRGETIPPQRWQEAAAQVHCVGFSWSVRCTCAKRIRLPWLEGQEVRSGSVVAETLLGGNTVRTSLYAFSFAVVRLHDQGAMTYWTICPHRVQRKIFLHTSHDSTTWDVRASVFLSCVCTV